MTVNRNPRSGLVVNLTRRERQVLAVLYRRGTCSAAEIQSDLPQPPTYSAVRALLRTLERKGYIQHQERGLRYVFTPAVPVEKASIAALREVVQTFFGGSFERAIGTLKTLNHSDPAE